ncbi:hypothetical protein ACQCU1_09440 [Sutcliffiella horikoshii]|uniref:Uncharacterized protein n=1 Tax=Sutcliffiella horikoshii TaxID=79883 RepID=A0A5D4TD87_9BACI|nr:MULTISPECIES: hypothetical protein [Bacillaceae]TYS61183.1 hypothetical protein FZC74_02605 [Sutcliffiella horikoshii]TYS73587.1 hypothetical protein FZC75_04445 [Sutcliffiella horikoshii]
MIVVQAFAVVHPIIELEDSIIIEFLDETEPEDSRRYRLFLGKQTLHVSKLIVFRPTLESWQDITSMLSPFYLASLRTKLMEQTADYLDKRDAIS